jgi:PKD domain-containing protein
LLPRAGNYNGWPYCQGNGLGGRKKLAGPAPGVPAPVGTSGTISGPPYDSDGQPTGGWNDCRHPILNDSPFNNGLQHVPAPQPVNFWWGGGASGCPDYRRDQNMLPFSYSEAERIERCPFAAKSPAPTGGELALTAGIYRVPDTADADKAWPAYWDGRWFLFNGVSLNATIHALLMPDNPDNTSLPVAADSLRAIVSKSGIPATALAIVGPQFGPDGSLYLLDYGRQYFRITDRTSLWRFSYVGGPETPGPDPQATATESPRKVQFSTGGSGGVSYHWDFGDGSTSDAANPTHTYQQAGDAAATLTVTYADGRKASRTVKVKARA